MRQNAAYEAAYQQTMRFLTDLSQEAETAIDRARDNLNHLQNQQAIMLASAPRWQDDQRLFRDIDGDVRDQHGQIIEGLAAEDVVWPENAPTYEDWRALEDRITTTQTHLNGWRDLRDNHIAPAQDRLSDEDNPPTIQEMEEMRHSIQAKADNLKRMENDAPDPVSAPDTIRVPEFDPPNL